MDLEAVIKQFEAGSILLAGFEPVILPALDDESPARALDSQPESFSSQDIDAILAALPVTVAAFPELTTSIKQNFDLRLRQQLEAVKVIDPHAPATIQYFIDVIKKHIIHARVEPGDTVGVSITALIEKLAQGALSSFHTAGSSEDVGSSIDTLISAMNANIKDKAQMRIIFYPRIQTDGSYRNYSFEELFRRMHHRFVRKTIADFVQAEPEIKDLQELLANPLDSWYPVAMKFWASEWRLEQDATGDFRFSGYDLSGQQLDLAPTFFRIKLDTDEMYKYRYTPGDIARRIQKSQQLKAGSYIIASPASVGIIDIYVSNQGLESYQHPFGAARFYFESVILPFFSKYELGGIKNISNMQVDYFNIEQALDISATTSDLHGRRLLWQVGVKDSYYRQYGISLRTLQPIWDYLAQENLIQVIGQSNNKYQLLTGSQEREATVTEEDFELIDTLIGRGVPLRREGTKLLFQSRDGFSITAQDYNEYRSIRKQSVTWGLKIERLLPREKRLVVKVTPDPSPAQIIAKVREQLANEATAPGKTKRLPTPIENMLTYSYIRTRGSNLKVCLQYSDIDPNRITTNDAREALQLLGLESARQILLDTFLQLITGSIEGESEHDSKHIKLLADYMTRNGIAAINYSGMVASNTQAISRIAFEKSTTGVIDAAATFSVNSALTMSAAEFTGAPPIGPGYNEVKSIKKLKARDLKRFVHERQMGGRMPASLRKDAHIRQIKEQMQVKLEEQPPAGRLSEPPQTVDVEGEVQTKAQSFTDFAAMVQGMATNNMQQVAENVGSLPVTEVPAGYVQDYQMQN